MKTLGNWKIKGDKIVIGQNVYFECGATGKPSLVGYLSQEAIAFCYNNFVQDLSFDELYAIVKRNTETKKRIKKEVKELKEQASAGLISWEEYGKRARAIEAGV